MLVFLGKMIFSGKFHKPIVGIFVTITTQKCHTRTRLSRMKNINLNRNQK